jgi:hypothetical protein
MFSGGNLISIRSQSLRRNPICSGTRGVFENLYWMGLAEEGEAFVRKMRDDDTSHSRARGQDIFKADVDLDGNPSDSNREVIVTTLVFDVPT